MINPGPLLQGLYLPAEQEFVLSSYQRRVRFYLPRPSPGPGAQFDQPHVFLVLCPHLVSSLSTAQGFPQINGAFTHLEESQHFVTCKTLLLHLFLFLVEGHPMLGLLVGMGAGTRINPLELTLSPAKTLPCPSCSPTCHRSPCLALSCNSFFNSFL